MINDLDENEDESEMAVERLGLRDIGDLAAPDLPRIDAPQQDKNASFGAEEDNKPPVLTQQQINQAKFKRVRGQKPNSMKFGLSLDVDQINKEHEDKEKTK